MSGGWQGVCGCLLRGGVSQGLCRMCCFSSQLCIHPQVSSCLSSCYDVLAALVMCLSLRLSLLLSPLVSIHLYLWMFVSRGLSEPLSPHTHSSAPVLDPSLSQWALLLGSVLP